MRAHGVPEINKLFIKKSNFDECIEKGQQVTRNYVKRQLYLVEISILKIHQKFDEFPDEIDLNSINFN